MGVQAKLKNTYDEYLEQEESALNKHEYHNGEILAMSGGSLNHSLIGANIVTCLNNEIRLKGKSCRTFNSDARVFLESLNHAVYPDASVVCGKPKINAEKRDSFTNPVLIVEVLSKSTGDYDRGEKFRKYRTLPSFREYVLIDQYQTVVDILRKQDDRTWNMETIIGLDKSIYLESLDLRIKMSDIYQDVEGLTHPLMLF